MPEKKWWKRRQAPHPVDVFMESLEQIAEELLTVLLVVAAETRGEPAQSCFTSLTALYNTKIQNVCDEIDKLEIFENTKRLHFPIWTWCAKIFVEQGYFLQDYFWRKATSELTAVVGLLTHEEAPFEMHFFRKVVKNIFSTHPFAKTYF